jgi:poly-gamma-glutamate synthesis protein (capsule biosynthesis protein)
VTLAAVGDTNGYNIPLGGQDGEDPLQGVRHLLDEGDVFIFNFEGVLLSQVPTPETCRKFPQQSLFYSPPQIADFLHPTQLTIATLANNHILDCGCYGIQETVHELASREILTVGAGENSEQACQPLRLQVNGVDLAVVAYLAMEPDWFSAGSEQAGAASWEGCAGEQQLAKLKSEVDIIVVALHLHLGAGWTEQMPPTHIALARRVLAAGADVVLAHGPHVPQGILQSNGGVALLSLGNFLFHPDYQMPEKAYRSIMATITISSNSITIALSPLKLDSFGRPEVPSPHEVSQTLRDIATLSATLGTTVEIHGDIGYTKIKRQR